MDNRPIGVFDSGLGGLTAVKQLMQELPNESIVYFGDTGRVPYGTRSKETIIKYVLDDVSFLKTFNIKLIVVACGTASAVALPVIKKDIDIPIAGVVNSTCSMAALGTKSKKIGVLGTNSTINSGAFEKQLKQIDSELEVFSVACPLFVPLVENGHTDTELVRLVAEDYLEKLKNKGIDTLILGCTHYPLLKGVISDIIGKNVKLIDAGMCVAKKAKDILTDSNMLSDDNKPNYSYYVSDNTFGFERIGGMFLQKQIVGLVKKVDIEKY